MSDRVRTTISLSPEAYEVFKRMADAGNLSVSRCMGDWLADTMEAAQMITVKMEAAKREPMRVVEELRAIVAGMATSVDDMAYKARDSRRLSGAQQRAAGAGTAPPPSSNTGVLSPATIAKPTIKPLSKRKAA